MACSSFALISWAPGDEAVATGILEDVKSGKRAIGPETLTIMRDALGDTSATIIQVKPHNAAYRALCKTASALVATMKEEP